MKILAPLFVALLFASPSTHAQVRGLADAPAGKADTPKPIHFDCGTGFAHGDTIEFDSPSGHHVALTMNKGARQAVVVRDGERWVGTLDAKNNLHIVNPKGGETVHTSMTRGEAEVLARATREQLRPMMSPCDKTLEVTKCLDVVQYSAPSTTPGPFSPAAPAQSQTKCMFEDYMGDAVYWEGVLFIDDFSGVYGFVPILDVSTSDQLLACMQQKSACNQVCNDGLALAGVACVALSAANVTVGVACAAGALVAYQACEGNCNAAFPNC